MRKLFLLLLAPVHAVLAGELCSSNNIDPNSIRIETRERQIRFLVCPKQKGAGSHCTQVGKQAWYDRDQLSQKFAEVSASHPEFHIYIGPTGTESIGSESISVLSIGAPVVGFNGVDALPLVESTEQARLTVLGAALAKTDLANCRMFRASSSAIRRTLEEGLAQAIKSPLKKPPEQPLQ